MNRTLLAATVLCFGGAALLAALAAWNFASVQPSTGWGFLIGATLFVGAGLVLQADSRKHSAALGERQSQLELLEAQVAQQRSAIDTLADGLEVALFICDHKATILYANRRAREIFHFESPAGRTILAVTLSYDLEQLVLKAARTREEHDSEMAFAYPSDRVGLAKAWPQAPGDRVFLSMYDITELRRLERIRRDFVSNVSHELRTPLTIIRSMAETMLDDAETPAAKKGQYLERIVSEVDRLSTMARDLLVLTTAESKPVDKQPCDAAEIFRNVTDELKPGAEEKGIEIRYQGPWNLVVEADAEQVHQVALNLVDNAISYTQSGRILVVVRQENDEFIASVNDSGVGIASEHLPRIFERFYRVDKGRARGTGGTGLGLSIVKHIVEAHGGQVSVDSALNEGSTFTMRLPMPKV